MTFPCVANNTLKVGADGYRNQVIRLGPAERMRHNANTSYAVGATLGADINVSWAAWRSTLLIGDCEVCSLYFLHRRRGVQVPFEFWCRSSRKNDRGL